MSIEKKLLALSADYERSDAVPLGRAGGASFKGGIALEQKAYAGARPRLYQLCGLAARRAEIEACRTEFPLSGALSNGGNGFKGTALAPFTIYHAENVLKTGGRLATDRFVALDAEAGLFLVPKGAALSFLTTVFQSDAARATAQVQAWTELQTAADAALGEIKAERATIAREVVEGIIVEAEFDTLPPCEPIMDELRTGRARDEIIATHAIPAHYIVREPVFAKAATPQEAVALARRIAEQRAAELAAARQAAAQAGLPALIGTSKQIAWAERIRAAFAATHPSHMLLRKATTAKYWIEHRFDLTN